jgi:hypothetical protein
MVHRRRANDSPIAGAKRNGILLIIFGLVCSFTNNLIASANGIDRPIKVALFGPFRNW